MPKNQGWFSYTREIETLVNAAGQKRKKGGGCTFECF